MSLHDRISNLPEPILHHILSFLSTKQAASTSVLSKPWQYLWTWVPDLDIRHPEKRANDHMRFENIILMVFLSRRAWRIRKFRLSYFYSFCDDLATIHKILCSAVERDIEELDFSFGDEDNNGLLELPSSLLRCKTLVVLKLHGSIMIDSGLSVHLPSLKVLHLRRMRYKDEDAFRNIISGCPVLDYLLVGFHGVDPDNGFHYEISSLTVRRVVLCKGGFCYAYMPSKITVSAPALQYLTVDYHIAPRFFVLSNISSSVHVNFNIRLVQLKNNCWEYIKDTFRALCSVQSLELNFTYSEGHEDNIPIDILFPIFDNLVALKLISYSCPLPLFLDILLNCTRLQHLTLVSKMSDCQCEPWISPEHVPNFLTFHLTTVKFEGFEGLEAEIEFVQYVLSNSEALKNMTIIYRPKINLRRKFEAFLRISMSEMLARKCQLNFQQQV